MTRAGLAFCLLAVAILGCRSPGRSTPDASSLLGAERGLDHVGIVVEDLAAARTTFHDRLGFGGLEDGKLPNGIQNTNYYFEDSTYLETLIAWDKDKARWTVDFLSRGEGASFFVLATSSLEGTAAFLAGNGVKAGAPVSGTIQTGRDQGPEAPRWRTMFIEGTTPTLATFFFIAYGQPQRGVDLRKLEDARRSGRIFKHPNTAMGIKGVWLAVPDLDAAVNDLARVGLTSLGRFDEPRLGAVGAILGAGQGKVLVVAPARAEGAVAEQLRRRGGPGLLGVSIEVAQLSVARGFVARATGSTVSTGRGALGASVFVPPAVAHGAWLELFQP